MFDITKNEKTCFSCTHYLRCNDERKSFLFRCDRFKSTPSSLKLGARIFTEESGVELDDPMTRTERAHYSPDPVGDFDIYSVIENVIHENALAPPDLKINDREFKQAPNFYVFSTSPTFLNTKPFMWQLIYAVILLADYCPACSNVKYLVDFKPDDSYGKFRKNITLLGHGLCPTCGKNRQQLVRRGILNFYEELAVNAGQRSGKSALIAMISTYLLHRLLKLQNPNEVYGLMPSNVLHGTFVSLTFGQAKENLWDPFYGNILESPWFQGYNEHLLGLSERRGDEIVKLKDNFINYKHRRLLFYPASPDKRILRGRTRVVGAIDEIGWFDNSANSNKIKVNANETYVALGNSLRTVRSKAEKLMKRGFYDVPTAYFMNISSPSSARDKIMDLVKKSVGSRKMFGVNKPTWELNPEISRESLAEEFRKDPVVAMRDYGAQPPLSSNPFISNSDTLLLCATGKRNPIRLSYARKRSPDGTHKRYGKIAELKRSGEPSVLCFDAGYNNNAFGLTVGHLKDGLPCIDLVAEVQPAPGVPLSYRAIYDNVIGPILEHRNIQLVVADRWNSLKILSDIEEDYEIVTLQYRLTYQEMSLFKEYMEDGEIILPSLPKGMTLDDVLAYNSDEYPKCFQNNPVGHFFLQLLTVQDTGSTVIKGDQMNDDIARSAMLATALLLNEQYAEFWERPVEEMQSMVDVKQMAVGRGASGGAFGGTGSQSNGSTPTTVLGAIKSRMG